MTESAEQTVIMKIPFTDSTGIPAGKQKKGIRWRENNG